MKTNWWWKGIAWLSGVCITLAMLVFALELVALNASFYQKQYQKLGQAQRIGISDQDLMRATDALLGYCKGQREDLSVMVTIQGKQQQMFQDETEIVHMKDVKALYQTAKYAQLGLCVAAGLGILLCKQGGKLSWSRLLGEVQKGFWLGVALIAALALWGAVDFDGFWVTFHQLAFTNDFWLLNPAASRLILMMPAELFFAMVMRIVAYFMGGMLILWYAAFFGGRRLRGREKTG